VPALAQASCVIRAGPPQPPQMPLVQLNFEVLGFSEEIYHHCAYDPIAFGCFFSRLNKCVLGHHDWAAILSDTNVITRGLLMAQDVVPADPRCAIEEVVDHHADQQEEAD
jgi:hypothetical protein